MPPKIKKKTGVKAKKGRGTDEGDLPKKGGKGGKMTKEKVGVVAVPTKNRGKMTKEVVGVAAVATSVPEDKIKVFEMLKSRGRVFQKYQTVFARQAEVDEVITTFTGRTEVETKAKKHDFVVRTMGDDPVMYVQSEAKFTKQYELDEEHKSDDDEFDVFKPAIKTVTAIVMTPQRLEDTNYYGALRPYDIVSAATSDMASESCTAGHTITCIPREAFYGTYAEPAEYTQAQMLELLDDDLKDATVYKKYKTAFARRASKEEEIVTVCKDGVEETRNTAKKGYWIVRATTEAEEEYVLTPKKFEARYELSDPQPADVPDTYAHYDPIGEVLGIKMTAKKMAKLQWLRKGYFVASWNESMVCLEGDFLVAPLDKGEVYRIAHAEFWETYKEKELKKKKKKGRG